MTENEFLAIMGLENLEGEEKDAALDNILSIINVRVGQRIMGDLSEDQFNQFEQLSDDADAKELAAWLEQNVPNYNQIVVEEAQDLQAETLTMVDSVMADEVESAPSA